MLDQDIEEYYNKYFELFMQEGWDQFIDDVKQASETISLLAIADAKELHTAQGQLHIFNRLINWKDSITNNYESVKAEDELEQNTGESNGI